jgi:hypothetical protein
MSKTEVPDQAKTAPGPSKSPMAELLALLEQVEFVIAVTAPMTLQQEEVWPELRRRAREARAAVRTSLTNENT